MRSVDSAVRIAPVQEAPGGGIIILPVARVQEAGRGVHQATEVADAEVARAVAFQRIAPGSVGSGVGDCCSRIHQVSWRVRAV